MAVAGHRGGARRHRAGAGGAGGVGGRKIEYANGFRLSPYSDLGPAITANPPRQLWHASPGSSGPTAA
ncbi:hypothetical protein ACFQ0B_25725 [Nonomuraea thailandensis]